MPTTAKITANINQILISGSNLFDKEPGKFNSLDSVNKGDLQRAAEILNSSISTLYVKNDPNAVKEQVKDSHVSPKLK